MKRAALVIMSLAFAGCGASYSAGGHADGGSSVAGLAAHPQAIEPAAGQQAAAIGPIDPVGDVHAHAAPLAQVRHELHLELVYAPVTSDAYIDPLQYVNHW